MPNSELLTFETPSAAKFVEFLNTHEFGLPTNKTIERVSTYTLGRWFWKVDVYVVHYRVFVKPDPVLDIRIGPISNKPMPKLRIVAGPVSSKLKG